MLLLDKTSCELLAYLIRLKKPKTIMAISSETNQSRRKIYYHLEKINDALKDENEQIMSRPRIGILLTKEQKALCQNLLEGIDFYSYIMSASERKRLMSLYICIAKERVTIDKLMDLTEVSRNTVLNDLNDIRSQLTTEQYQVNLYSTKARGYYLACHPLNKIQYLHSLLYHIFNEGSEGFIGVLIEKITLAFEDEILLSDSLHDFLSQQLPLVEQDLGKKINRHEIEFMLKVLPYLLLSCRNMQVTEAEEKSLIQEFSLIRKRIEYQVAKRLAKRMREMLQVSLSEIDISLLAVLFLSYRKDRDIHATSQDFAQLQEALDEFLWRFEAASIYELEQRDDLMRNLLTHCKALLFRKTYGILSKNPLTKQIKNKYAELYALTKACVPILEEAWLIRLTDDEVAYLTIHMGGALKNSQAEKRDRKNIYLICDEGVSLSKLLLKQCSYYLPNESLETVFTTEQFRSVEDILVADFLITTNEDLETSFPTVQVHPILNYEDIFKITHMIKRDLALGQQDFEQELTQILSYYLSEQKQVEAAKQQIQLLIGSRMLEHVDKELKEDDE